MDLRKGQNTQLRADDGIALVIVLAFVVLLTGLIVAYLSRTSTDRQLAHGTFHEAKADELARAALGIVVGDLKQEIVNGSASPAPVYNGVPLYSPTAAANILPMRSGTPDPTLAPTPTPIPNLVRRSYNSGNSPPDPIPTPGVPSRASAVSSTTPSSNGRFISTTRWNTSYFVPKANTGNSDSIPVASFAAPDWVFITDTGPSIITAPSASVTGRYAFAVYDEGGLVDVNVAGYPTNTDITQYGRKGSLPFADLSSSTGTNIAQAQVDRLVGWRNYATTAPAGDFSNGFTFNATAASKYSTYVLANTTGFLGTGTIVSNGLTDQSIVSRQELIKLQSSAGFTPNSLQYLTHFTREADAAVPQWSPATPTAVNPNFQTLRVTGAFLRNDGSTAKIGEPLVKQRFLLQRLNWLTYRGPSASRTIPASQPVTGDPDYDMWLISNRFGLTSAFLQQGTDENIAKYFGLAWDGTNDRWNYVGHGGGTTAIGSIPNVGTLTALREPDFFELLRAGIINTSLGSASSPNAAMPIAHQQSTTLQIVTIGANLLALSRADAYPVRIGIDSGAGAVWEAVGSSRLPYVNSLGACPVAGVSANGGVNWFLIPNLWDPFRDTWDLSESNVSSTLTPGYPRPPIRITIRGTVGFGAVTASPSVQSGSVASGVTTFSTAPAAFNASQTLKTGGTVTSGIGRDGLGEATRLGTSDFPTAPPTSTPTTSQTTATTAWNSISRPPRTNGTFPGSNNFVVYRLSLPGSAIPPSAVTPPQNPVLILRSGFQLSVDYQSPTGSWFPYSYLQGNNATATWISADINLTTTASQYGVNAAPTPAPAASATVSPTVVNSGTATATAWDMTTLAKSPMFAKADPRSIRFNSQIGVLDVPLPNPAPTASPVPTPWSAGIIGSLWPSGYSTPPSMTPGSNPASYSQSAGDNGPAGSNPYDETIATTASVRPIVMNRPFRSVGEMAYAFRDQPFKTIDFSSANSPDAGLLDLFTVNEYKQSSGARAGAVNLNTRQAAVLASVLSNTLRREDTPRQTPAPAGSPSPQPSPLTAAPAGLIAASVVAQTTPTPVMNRAELTGLINNETALGPTVQKTQRESIARALGDVGQTRTWNLMIDVIAQSGKYPASATALKDFIVQGEKRYWLHVAIDRFTGQVIDQQLEAVYE